MLRQVEQASRELPSPGTTEQGKLGKIRKKKVVTSEPQSVNRLMIIFWVEFFNFLLCVHIIILSL